ncbi:MAG TPA: hypothetical protein VEZ71_10385, partial [Archangium sp.]|nr:hypothetical protein [Archangium sp.]
PARPGTLSQDVLITSVPGVLELFASLEYLSEYPHGCLEQKLSQLYPDVAQAALLRDLGIRTPFGKQLNGNVQRIQDEMSLYQDDQGLLAFWPGGPGDVQVTALAVEFLDGARRAGLKVDEKPQTRAVEGLKRVLRSTYPGLVQEWRYNQQTAALRALTRVGSLDQHYLIDLFQLRNRLDIQSLADLASTMSTQPTVYRTNLEVLRNELWDSVIIKLNKGKPVFEGLKWRRDAWGYYGYLSSRSASVAAVFEALVLLSPEDARLEQLRDALLSYASAETGFGSTFENRRAIAALALYLAKAKPAVPDTTVTLSSGAALKVNKDTKTARAEVASDAQLSATVKGGPVGMRVEAQYIPATPGDKVTPLKQGFIVSRGATWLHADGSEETRFDDASGEVKELKVGDILELHARIVTEEERVHVALVVPFAAGLEPLNPELANASSDAKPSQADSLAPAYVQRLDNEVRYYFLKMPPGTHTFHFRVRAATEGSFVHPAPWAELMYRESVRGRGEGLRIVVKGEHEK